MSDLNPKAVGIKLGNKDYGMRFTLNAIDDIQDHFDISISDITELFKDPKTNIKALRYMLTTLINEDIEVRKDNGEAVELLTEKYVGRHIDTTNMGGLIGQIMAVFSGSLPEGDESPNAPGEPTD